MKATDRISYPLSRAFMDTGISKEVYTLLCHYADQTEGDTPTCHKACSAASMLRRQATFRGRASVRAFPLADAVPQEMAPPALGSVKAVRFGSPQAPVDVRVVFPRLKNLCVF
ncbi:hypothetical protein HPB51_021011 [Rhipicephalus microplus]|uniref:Uncharacterized protein n=1 Tax=Rhipicephalus microplus TaxID=6941 RepID=A0A9J6DCN5_RHIMP|nr:hypothetical protein HPB51_021011 [Rhipicephalus microplus]